MIKLDFCFMSPYDGVLEAHLGKFHATIDGRCNGFHIYISKDDGTYFEHDVDTLYEALDYANEQYNLVNKDMNNGGNN